MRGNWSSVKRLFTSFISFAISDLIGCDDFFSVLLAGIAAARIENCNQEIAKKKLP